MKNSKKVVVINLGGEEAAIFMVDLVSSIKNANPDIMVSVLVEKKFENFVKFFPDIDRIFAIDRKYIQKVFKSKTYPLVLALNQFMELINDLKAQDIDTVVNMGNCSTSAYLAGFFAKSSKVFGRYYTSKNAIAHSSEWSIVLNELGSRARQLPFHIKDVYRRMLGLSKVTLGHPRYIIEKGMAQVISKNIKNIKKIHLFDNKDVHIVGVYFESQSLLNGIFLSKAIEIITKLKNEKKIFPLLIVLSKNNDCKAVHLLNSRFGQSLSFVEATFCSLPGLVKNLDALLTYDTEIKQLADLMQVPSVELSLEKDPVLEKSSSIDGNIILRSASSGEIVDLTLYRLGEKKLEKKDISREVLAYGVKRKNYQIFYEKIGYKNDGIFILKRIMVQEIIEGIIDTASTPKESINNGPFYFNKNQMNVWVKLEESMAKKFIDHLQNSVSLINRSKNKAFQINKIKAFLEDHLESSYGNSLIGIIGIFLREKIKDQEDSDKVERYLLLFKNYADSYFQRLQKIKHIGPARSNADAKNI